MQYCDGMTDINDALSDERFAFSLDENKRKEKTMDDHIAYFDGLMDTKPVEVPIGRSFCNNKTDIMLTTNVGSGIAICVHDPMTRSGGMVHIILPSDFLDSFPYLDDVQQAFAQKSEAPIKSMLETMTQLGARAENISVKLFGAAEISQPEAEEKARKTVAYVREFFLRHKINIMNADIGKSYGRRIQFVPTSGIGMIRFLRRDSDIDYLATVESDYFQG